MADLTPCNADGPLQTDWKPPHGPPDGAAPADTNRQARRVCDRFALIAAGGELATGLNLTGCEPGTARQAAGKCFKYWLDNRRGPGVLYGTATRQ